GWWYTWQYARRAWRQRPKGQPAGILTVFPPLAVTSGLRGRLSPADAPIVARCFHMARLYCSVKGSVARFALPHVPTFVVPSRGEIGQYSRWLDLPPDRFEFVHLQRAVRPITRQEERDKPFVLAMGSAKRDYRTFLAAVGKLKLPTVVVAAPYALEGLTVPP